MRETERKYSVHVKRYGWVYGVKGSLAVSAADQLPGRRTIELMTPLRPRSLRAILASVSGPLLVGLALMPIGALAAGEPNNTPTANERDGNITALVELEVVDVSADPSRPVATLRLRNHADHSFSYGGYSPTDIIYYRQRLRDGKWEADDPGWCGTGIASYVVEASQGVEFTASLWSGPGPVEQEPARIGVDLHDTVSGTKVVVWSAEISPPAKP